MLLRERLERGEPRRRLDRRPRAVFAERPHELVDLPECPARHLLDRLDRLARTLRILQEALTNAARHGLGSAEVEIRSGEQAVEISVTNPAPLSAGVRDGGHGIVGMRERASLLGGTLEASASGGLFEVRAGLPYTGGEPA